MVERIYVISVVLDDEDDLDVEINRLDGETMDSTDVYILDNLLAGLNRAENLTGYDAAGNVIVEVQG